MAGLVLRVADDGDGWVPGVEETKRASRRTSWISRMAGLDLRVAVGEVARGRAWSSPCMGSPAMAGLSLRVAVVEVSSGHAKPSPYLGGPEMAGLALHVM